MDINQAFPSRWIKAVDLGSKTHAVEIHSVTMEKFTDGTEKPAIWFKNREKALILNRTNSATIAEHYGPDTDKWIGQPLELFSMRVQGPSGMVDGTRVRIPEQPKSPAGQAAIVDSDLDDDIPF